MGRQGRDDARYKADVAMDMLTNSKGQGQAGREYASKGWVLSRWWQEYVALKVATNAHRQPSP